MRIAPTRDVEACRALRRAVFIDEQGISEADEWDGHDGEAVHLLAWDGDRAVGTARIMTDGDTGKIGRVCVLAEARGAGVGAGLIRAAIAELQGRPGIARARLSSQTHALPFYERLGFTAFGPVYDDAGIPHRDMMIDL